jgi:hypothetical protein
MKYLLFVVFFIYGSLSHSQTVVSTGSAWKYYDQGDVGTTNWINNNFDDSAWATGNAEFGYGDGDEATIVSFGGNSGSKHITTYFRKSINIAEQKKMKCKIKYDDGVVVYLNGIKVFQAHMPSGSTNFNTLATAGVNENTWYSFDIPSNQIVIGNNTIAVEIHQVSLSSSDISFNFEAELNDSYSVYINEVLTSNDGYGQDETNESQDWVEIYNDNSYSFDLSGFFITDDKNNPTKHQLPPSTTVPANGRIILWASGEPLKSPKHLNFKLSSDQGEWIGLFDSNGIGLVDSLKIPERQRTNVSYGRLNDGSSSLRYFKPSSHNQSNKSYNSYIGILPPPNFSHESGFFQNSFNLTLSSLGNATIYYTDDSSEPDDSNLNGQNYSHVNSYAEQPGQSHGSFTTKKFRTRLYNSPILIIDKTSQGNHYAGISSTYDKNPNYFPSNNRRIHTLKAFATKSGYIESDVVALITGQNG